VARSSPARLDGALSAPDAAPAGTASSCPPPSDASGPHESADASGATNGASGVLTTISHVVHLLWWGVAAAGLVAGVMYLARGAPEVTVEVAPTFFGLFTVAGVTGTVLSFYLYFVGRHYMDEAGAGRLRDRFGSAYETFQHAAMETSMVTVWVLAGYLLYEYTMGLFALDLRALSTMAGVFAPAAGAALGLVPGCTPQIIFAQLYAVEEVIPFSALAANAISQDGDALFPLMAIDMKAALIATIYTTIPALVVGALVYYLWPFARFGFGVLG
ncbi:putative manganese transporter, partial [Salinibacter ruber]